MSKLLQAIVDTAYTKLFEQGTVSVVDRNDTTRGCSYRVFKDDGTVLKCAVGHLIPDEDYTPTMEGKSAFSLFRHHEGLFDKVVTKLGINPASVTVEMQDRAIHLMRSIQCKHDSTVLDEDTPEVFKAALREGLPYLVQSHNGISIDHLLKD